MKCHTEITHPSLGRIVAFLQWLNSIVERIVGCAAIFLFLFEHNLLLSLIKVQRARASAIKEVRLNAIKDLVCMVFFLIFLCTYNHEYIKSYLVRCLFNLGINIRKEKFDAFHVHNIQ